MFWATPRAHRQIELLVLAGCLVLTVSTLSVQRTVAVPASGVRASINAVERVIHANNNSRTSTRYPGEAEHDQTSRRFLAWEVQTRISAAASLIFSSL